VLALRRLPRLAAARLTAFFGACFVAGAAMGEALTHGDHHWRIAKSAYCCCAFAISRPIAFIDSQKAASFSVPMR
jgi:hypothetical protein